MSEIKINLPATSFPMKANLPTKEPEILKFWEQINLYEELRSNSKDREKFILHDGPPYANGHIHIGTALNKILKDIVVRFNQIKPSFGVYSVKIIFNKKTYKGIANFGVRPTFGNSRPILEVNFFGKNHNFYNKNIKVLFIDFIRKEKKFKNSTMLVRQIKKDIKVAKISLNKK